MEPQLPSTLEAARLLLHRQAGGYLRNVTPRPGLTCELCSGVPGNPDFSTCFHCQGWQSRTDLVDRLGFVTYALAGTQSGHVMHAYKGSPPANQHIVMLMLTYTAVRHWGCISTRSPHGAVTHWATVPSLRGRTGEHPLSTLAGPLVEAHKLAPARLEPRAVAGSGRQLRSDHFAATVADGAHVLLLDDTWTTGSNLQSAAAALKLAGAQAVTGLVLARWLDPSRGQTKQLIDQLARETFNPDACPFTGGMCEEH